jgi:hypothetical protein
MESESGAKIAIRGKGSVKEGKGRSDAAHTSNQEEDLHCLIMADTEDKVNKAKKLIHNVIETVSLRNFTNPPHVLTMYRLPLFPKARTSLSATNFANSRPSTEPFVTTKTRLARIVVKSVTANTIVRRNRITLLVSSAESADRQVIWLAIALTVNEAKNGVTMTAARSIATHPRLAALRMSWMPSWQKWVVVVPLMDDLNKPLSTALLAMTTRAAKGSVT